MKKRLLGIVALLSLCYGCSGAGYLPYAPHALDTEQIEALVSQASQTNGVPEGLVHAVLMAESAGDPSAVSVAGAQGLDAAHARHCEPNVGSAMRLIRSRTSNAELRTFTSCFRATTTMLRSPSPPTTRDRVRSINITASRRMRNASIRRPRYLSISQLLKEPHSWRR